MSYRMLPFLLFLSLPLFVHGQWMEALGDQIAKMNEAETSDDWLAVVAIFQQLADEHPEQWLPLYYESQARFKASYMLHNEGKGYQRKRQLDSAQVCVDRALAMGGDSSELYVIQGLIFQGRIWSNPMVNGPSFSSKSIHILKEAIRMNPNNPRAPHMIGQLLFHLPTFLGGGMEATLPWLKDARNKYEKFVPEGMLYPNWGAADLLSLLSEVDQVLGN